MNFDDMKEEVTTEGFSCWDNEETQTRLLLEIHNRLAEISKFLEIGIAMFAKLSADELEMIGLECQKIGITKSDIHKTMHQDDNLSVGYGSKTKLYFQKTGKENEPPLCWFPLGVDDTRSWPLDENSERFLTFGEWKRRINEENSQKG